MAGVSYEIGIGLVQKVIYVQPATQPRVVEVFGLEIDQGYVAEVLGKPNELARGLQGNG